MKYAQNREFLKSGFQFDFLNKDSNPLADSDQSKGLPKPPVEKSYSENELIYLPNPIDVELKKRDIIDIIDSRESKRIPPKEFSLHELSFILWATYGLRINNNNNKKRTVPSGGSRYPFETYVLAFNVKNLPKGLYRYIWSKHAVIPVNMPEKNMNEFERYSCPVGSVNLIWTVIPYRGEWRYMQHSHKICVLDAGHIGQNGYLAAEALGRGCCAVAGYSQADIDRLLGMDGVDEFTCYIEAFM